MSETPAARLIGLSGPTTGRVFVLENDVVALGRDPASDVVVDAEWISREHCEIRRTGDSYLVVDRGSHNGTSVNGVFVTERRLESGDRLALAGAAFLFVLGEPSPEASELGFEEVPLSRRTVKLEPKDAVFLHPDKLRQAALERDELRSALAAFLRLVELGGEDAEGLPEKLLDVFFELVPAERGAILIGDSASELESVTTRSRDGSRARVVASRTVLASVWESGAALLSDTPFEDTATKGAKSLARSKTTCLVCLPLTRAGGPHRPFGAIYLDSAKKGASFSESSLDVLMGLARVAAGALDHARQLGKLRTDAVRLVEELDLAHEMIGESEALHEAQRILARVAPTDTTVLVQGESGTGKELAARAIHFNSNRRDRLFVKVDCTALSENLLASDLFGHERGAFTGAIQQKKGKFEVASGGTVFLDEVGELPLPLQSQLLRVLQDRELERVGGTRPIPVDVRIVAATNRDLAREVREHRFREDLFFRLGVVVVNLPPLRERRSDIGLLARYFASELSRKVKRPITGFSEEAMRALERHDWPGNVRELANAIERAAVLGSTERILPEDLPELLVERPAGDGDGAPGGGTSFHEAVAEKKRELVLAALERSGGTVTEAARALGLHPNYLHRLIRNLGLREP